MAKVNLGKFHQGFRGKVDGLVYYPYYGKTCVRMHVKPFDPRTKKQRKQREAFTEAVLAWQALPEEEKEYWLDRGRRKRKNGRSAFISDYLKPSRKDFTGETEYRAIKKMILQPEGEAFDNPSPDDIISLIVPASLEHRTRLATGILRL